MFAVIDGEVNAVEKFAVPIAVGDAGKVKVFSQEEVLAKSAVNGSETAGVLADERP